MFEHPARCHAVSDDDEFLGHVPSPSGCDQGRGSPFVHKGGPGRLRVIKGQETARRKPPGTPERVPEEKLAGAFWQEAFGGLSS
jgi:hypothetical protein